MHSANILICGKIRDVAALKVELEKYLRWRDEGAAKRIGFSGWSSDLAPHAALFDELRQRDIDVVLSPEPQVKLSGYIFHQMKALNFGLSLFEPGDLVLKTRTDRVDTHFELRYALDRYFEAPPPAPGSPFGDRVMVQYASPFQPYFFGDQVFMGRRRDLMKLVTFDMWFEAEHAFLNPEQVMHSAPHLARRPLLKDFFRANPGLQYGQPQRARDVYRLMLANPVYRGAIHASMRDLMDFYVLGFKPDEPGQRIDSWPEGLTLHDLLDGDVASQCDLVHYFELAATISTASPLVIRRMMDMQVSRYFPGSLASYASDPDGSPGSPADRSAALSRPAEALARDLTTIFPGLSNLSPPPDHADGLSVFRAGASLFDGIAPPPSTPPISPAVARAELPTPVSDANAVVIDLDGTLTIDDTTKSYADRLPHPGVVARLRELSAGGYRIVVHTARNMRSHAGRIGLINAQTLPLIIDWLRLHDIPFDEVIVGKPWCGPSGFYVDDRAIRPDEFVRLDLESIADVIKGPSE